MAFLDNSGDIILDAVLTETGRKRLAEAAKNGGSGARIVSYALGDDEINYAEYDLNNPMGSNYADLEIMQTPILEAFTMANSSINYGLLKIQDTELLYLPSLKVNEKSAASTFPALQNHNGLYYFAVNNTTYNALVDLRTGEGISAEKVGKAYLGPVAPYIFIEGGLNTSELTKDVDNRQTYILGNDISNRRYFIGLDSRLTGRVFTSNTNGVFANKISNNDDLRVGWSVQRRQVARKVTERASIRNYNFFPAAARPNSVVVPNTNGTADQYSTILGPGDTVTCFKPIAKSSLRTDGTSGGARDVLYTQIGSTSVSAASLFNGSTTGYRYDFIDSMVYVFGARTGASISIPVRIIRRVST